MLTMPRSPLALVLVALFAAVTPRVAAARQEEPPAIRVFTEHPLADPTDELTSSVLTPMIQWFGAPWHHTNTAEQARQIAARLADVPRGYRAVSLEWVFASLLKPPETGKPYWVPGYPVDLVRPFETGRLDPTFEIRRLSDLADALEDRGIALDFIYLDVEHGLSFWHLTGEQRARVVSSPGARRLMPPALLELVKDGKEPPWGDPRWRDYVIQFNRHGNAITARALREALLKSGLLQPGAVAINFATIRPGFPIYDDNGWPTMDVTPVDGRTNGPVFFLPTRAPFRYPPPALEKDPIWNALIEHVNHLRSCLRTGPVVPILTAPPPVPGAAFLHDQLIAHCVRSGVTTFDFFNVGVGPERERAVARSFRAHAKWARSEPPRTPLEEIPLDADEIRTEDFITTYAEYLRHKHADTPASGAPGQPPR